ncbi:uncharacterized protein OCT59_014751 [Rhizophagus irregularis]|uniref:uncharacterized protein n=1 Tax=Rhizophagus irregularis TaxID=588596 RepID=UPI0033347639|nr:hypothetical protein OCT59_014751 [Rhizophagus irregularis]
MITLVLHDHMTDIKKLLQQKVALKKIFSFVNSLLNSPSTPHQLFNQFLHQKLLLLVSDGFFKSLLSQILSTNSSGWDTSISNTPLSFL